MEVSVGQRSRGIEFHSVGGVSGTNSYPRHETTDDKTKSLNHVHVCMYITYTHSTYISVRVCLTPDQ